MVDLKLGTIWLALSLFVLGLRVDADDSNVAKDALAKQGIYHQTPDGRLFAVRPRRQRRQFLPPGYPEFPPPGYPNSPPPVYPQFPPVQPDPPSSSYDARSFIMFFTLLRALAEGTAAPTTPATPETIKVCVGTWSDWGACSAKCAGTQTRKHSCSGAVEQRPCNGPDFTSTGWYRAINCYEYFVSANAVPQTAAKTACEARGAKLIHVGLRNSTVTADVMQNLAQFSTNPENVHIGLEFISSDWQWEDGDTTEPMIWATSTTPAGNGANVCAHMELGNPRSAAQGTCTTSRNYICERKVT